MTNQTQTAAPNDVMKLAADFGRTLGNGKKAASHLHDMVVSVVKSRDTKVLSRAYAKADGKGDKQAVQTMSAIIRAVWPGVKTTKDKNTGEMIIKIKGIEADPAPVARFADAVQRGLSLRDTLRKHVCDDPNAAEPTFTDDQIIEGLKADFAAFVKREAKKYGIDEARVQNIAKVK